jgi:hypothetical protein
LTSVDHAADLAELLVSKVGFSIIGRSLRCDLQQIYRGYNGKQNEAYYDAAVQSCKSTDTPTFQLYTFLEVRA